MIHNIAEEREKLHKNEPSGREPFSDEELARLIGQVEERALIHAPVHLKGNIFSQISAERQKVKKRQLFIYRAKVLAGMAAALAVLFRTPVERERTADMPAFESFLQVEETAGGDEWDQEVARRQEDIEKTWEKYQEGQRREDITKRYLRDVAEKLKNKTDWEDE